MGLNLLTKVLLHCALFVLIVNSEPQTPDLELCVNKKICNYEKRYTSTHINCHFTDYKQAEKMFTCFKSCKDRTINHAVLLFPVNTQMDSHLLDGHQIENLILSNVSNPDSMAFDQITDLKTLELENGNLTEIPLSIRSLKNLTGLSLINQKLKTIPDFAFRQMKSLRHLTISSNPYQIIGQNAFTGLDNIYGVDLSDNKLTSEATGAFRNLPGFVYLYLTNNQIRKLASHAFGNQTHLSILDLSHNPISSIHKDAFTGIIRLDVLNITATNLTSVPSHAFKNLFVQDKLLITHNPIAELKAKSFLGLTALRTLEVGSKDMSFVHEDAFVGLDSLNYLSIQDTKLASIPVSAISKVPNLEHLCFLRNNVTTNSESGELSNLTWLRSLDFSGSRFSLTQDSFKGFDWLADLILRNQNLTSVPSGAIRNLSRLSWLDLRDNGITKLEENAFFGLNQLALVWLEDNQISSIAVDAFTGLEKSLAALYLKNSNLTKIPKEALRNMKRLGQVSFGNFIEYLEADTFKDFGQNINVIDLSGNRIKSFAQSAFHHLPKLTRLELQNNQIHHLDFAVFQPIVNQIQHLFVNGNPLVCNCDLYWYYQIGQEKICSTVLDHGYTCKLGNDVCHYYGTNEKECIQKWKPVMCNATSVFGCVGERFCKREVGCVFHEPAGYYPG